MLTGKQELFTQEYIKNGGNATAAYKVAYNCSNWQENAINVQAVKMLKNPKIVLRLEEHQKKIEDKFEITVEGLQKELKSLLEYGMQEEELKDKDGNLTGKTRKVNPKVAIDAIDKLAKMIGAYKEENVTKRAEIDLSKVPDEILKPIAEATRKWFDENF